MYLNGPLDTVLALDRHQKRPASPSVLRPPGSGDLRGSGTKECRKPALGRRQLRLLISGESLGCLVDVPPETKIAAMGR